MFCFKCRRAVPGPNDLHVISKRVVHPAVGVISNNVHFAPVEEGGVIICRGSSEYDKYILRPLTSIRNAQERKLAIAWRKAYKAVQKHGRAV